MSYVKQGDYKDLIEEVPDGSVDLILTDIPYNISRPNSFQTMPDRKGRTGGGRMSKNEDLILSLKAVLFGCEKFMEDKNTCVFVRGGRGKLRRECISFEEAKTNVNDLIEKLKSEEEE